MSYAAGRIAIFVECWMGNGVLAVLAHQGWFSLKLGDDLPSLAPYLGAFREGFPAELEPRHVPLISLDHVCTQE